MSDKETIDVKEFTPEEVDRLIEGKSKGLITLSIVSTKRGTVEKIKGNRDDIEQFLDAYEQFKSDKRSEVAKKLAEEGIKFGVWRIKAEIDTLGTSKPNIKIEKVKTGNKIRVYCDGEVKTYNI